MIDLAMNHIAIEFKQFLSRASIVGGDMEYLGQRGLDNVRDMFGGICLPPDSIDANSATGCQQSFSKPTSVARHA